MAEVRIAHSVDGGLNVVTLAEVPSLTFDPDLFARLRDAIGRAVGAAEAAVLIYIHGRDELELDAIAANNSIEDRASLRATLQELERSTVPTVAYLRGPVLGVGLEIALACRYIICASQASLGFRDLRVGVLPLFGAIHRALGRAGREAVTLFTDEPISARRALSMGLVDRIDESGRSTSDAVRAMKALLGESQGCRAEHRPDGQAKIDIAALRKRLAKRFRRQLAPQKLLDCIEGAATLSATEAAAQERELAEQCFGSEQVRPLTHIYMAEFAAGSVPDLPQNLQERPIATIAVIGAGTMGQGIAIACLDAGLEVILLEANDVALRRGLDGVQRHYRLAVERGRTSVARSADCMARLRTTIEYQAIASVDLVIEAVFESMDVKRDVFRQLDAVCKPGALLTTNTSYLDVDVLAACTARPGDVVGLHFFSPANVMRLVEVVRGRASSAVALLTAIRFAKRLGKIPVVARVCHGFIGNRMLRQYNREVQLCLIEGATPQQIDTAIEQWGFAMGPLAVADLSGLDIGYRARQAMDISARGDPRSYAIADALVEAGRLGRKSGAGYYSYAEGSSARQVDPSVMELIAAQARRLGVDRRAFEDDEIIERVMLALINEGARLLQEGIAQRASDIDVVYCNGYGFPAFRGGPMFYADELGMMEVQRRLLALRTRLNAEHWTPAPLIAELAQSGGSLLDWNAVPEPQKGPR